MDANDEVEFIVLCCGAASVLLMEEEQNKQRKERVWVREWVRKRNKEGCCAKLLKELREEVPDLYKNFLRMNSKDFDHLVRIL